jgi:tetratricopeptide (TPR) repeat protein
MKVKKKRRFKFAIAGAVAVATLLVYLTALRNDFINWDDGAYIFENPHIRLLNAAFFKWAFFDFYSYNWHPLTWMSHALDYAIWGLSPLGHHLTNIILHAINTFTVVFLVIRLLDAFKRTVPNGQSSFLNEQTTLIAAGTTGLLFGLHPLHVESVAWVAERKDLLCALFYLLSIMTYTNYVGSLTEEASQRISFSRFINKHYLLARAFFILALLSKPMAVSLPAVLLLLDWFPYNRIRSLKTLRPALIEKLPLVVLSFISSIVTVLAQKSGGAISSIEIVPLSIRVLVGVKALISYLWKMALPLNLIPYYSYPRDVSIVSPVYLSAVVLVIGLTAGCVVMIKKQKLWLTAWGYYVVTLLPVLGIIQVGGQSMADRYTYLPSLGPFIIIGVFAAWILGYVSSLKKWGLRIKVFSAIAAVSLLVLMSYKTLMQIGIWENSIVFWNYVIEKDPNSFSEAYDNRGQALEKTGQIDRAIADYDKAIALAPSDYEVYDIRGQAFHKMGQLERAIADYSSAIALNPSDSGAYNNRGLAFDKMGQLNRAIMDYDSAIALNPSDAHVFINRGFAYFKAGQVEFSIADMKKACDLGNAFGCQAVQVVVPQQKGQ